MGAGERLRDLDGRVLPAVALLSVTAVLVTAVWASGHHRPGPPSAPKLTRIGLVEGQPIAGYLRSSAAELAVLASRSVGVDTWALVSFSTYVAPQRMSELLSGAQVHQVYVRAPLAGVQTQVRRIGVHRVPEDVVAGMLDAARHREQERSEFVRLSGAVGSGGDAQRLHRAYDTAAQVAAAEAEAYRAACSCVFAAVVHADAATLTRVAAGPEVRVVDPAPEVTGLAEVEFRPPLPEQVTGGPGAPEEPAPAAVAQSSRTSAARTSAQSPVVTSASSADQGPGSAPPARTGSPDPAVPSAPPPDPSAATPSEATGASREASGR